MPLVEDLSRISLFEGLKRPQLVRLAGIASARQARRGQVVFRQGDPAEGFYGIRSGRVKLYRLGRGGRQQVLHFFGAGDVFGEAAVFTGSTFPAFAEALADTRLIYIPREPFIEALSEDPQLALNMLATLSRYLRQFARLIEELSLRDVSMRLARYLVELAEREPAGEGPPQVRLEVSRTELAAHLGTVSETVSRTFGRFRDLGLVEVRGRTITLLDLEGLRSLASGGVGSPPGPGA